MQKEEEEEEDICAPPTPSLDDIHSMLSREGGSVSFMKRLKRSTYARILRALRESTDPEASFDDQIDRISEIFELVDLWVQRRDDVASIVYDSTAHWSHGPRESIQNKRAEALRCCVGMLKQKQVSLEKQKERYIEMVSSFEKMMTGKIDKSPPLAPSSSPRLRVEKSVPLSEEEEDKNVLLHEKIFTNKNNELTFKKNVRYSLMSMKTRTDELEKRRIELEKMLDDLQTQSKAESTKLWEKKEEEKTTTTTTTTTVKINDEHTTTTTFRQEVCDAIRKWSTEAAPPKSSSTKPRESTVSSTSTLCSLLETTLSRRRTRLMSECSDFDSPDVMSPGHGIMYGKVKEENWRLTHEVPDEILHRRSQFAKSLAEHLSKEKATENDTIGVATLGLAAVSVLAASVRDQLRKDC